jgi:hypothetical protein
VRSRRVATWPPLMCVVEMMGERRKGFRKHCSKCSRIVLGNSVLLPGRAAAVRWQYVVSDDDSAMAVPGNG